MTKRQILIRGGTILLMDAKVRGLTGDVLIEDYRIAASLRKFLVDSSDAEVIDARDHIVVPGFIGTYRHLYQQPAAGAGVELVPVPVLRSDVQFA